MNSSNFVCAVIWRRNMDFGGSIEFLIMKSRSTHPETGVVSELQTKFPGGTTRPEVDPEESVLMILKREILEETGLMVVADNPQKIWERRVSPNHVKHAFLLEFPRDCQGVLRTEQMRDRNDEMSPPQWVGVRQLWQDIFPSHEGPYLTACRELGVAL